MNNPSTVEQLREMRFSAMANEFEIQLRDSATYAQIPFEDRLAYWLMRNGIVGRRTNWFDVYTMLILIFLLPAWKRLNITKTQIGQGRTDSLRHLQIH